MQIYNTELFICNWSVKLFYVNFAVKYITQFEIYYLLFIIEVVREWENTNIKCGAKKEIIEYKVGIINNFKNIFPSCHHRLITKRKKEHKIKIFNPRIFI